MNKENIKRQLNHIWQGLKEIDVQVNRDKMKHKDAIINLSTEMRNLTTLLNQMVDKL